MVEPYTKLNSVFNLLLNYYTCNAFNQAQQYVVQ